MDSIINRALLVYFSATQWGDKRQDKTVTKEVKAAHGASRESGEFTKRLLAGAPKLKRVSDVIANARNAFKFATLPWSDRGTRLLPTMNYREFVDMMNGHHAMYETALSEFLAEFETLKEEARLKLGTLYKESDYPTVNEVRESFSWGVKFSPVPDAGDIRVDLGKAEIAEIKLSVENRVQQAVKDAAADAWERLFDAVSRIKDRLGDPDNIFRDSLIEGNKKLCETLSRLNITNDPNLDRMREKVERELLSVTPTVLRTDTTVRQQTADAAARILADIGGYFSQQ
jgi:hypothetical protein